MSVFVSDQLFEISIEFQLLNADSILQNSEGIGVEIIDSNVDQASIPQLLVCQAKGRDWHTYSVVKEKAAFSTPNNERVLRASVLNKEILLNFFKSMKVYNHENNTEYEVDITPENINKMHYDLVVELATQWRNKTGG